MTTKPRISLDALLVLDAIARRGSFAAAAEELHRVPSSVTYAIQKLEESLDTPLFDRRGHRARLTRAGEALLREGRDLLTLTDRVARNVKRIAPGERDIRAKRSHGSRNGSRVTGSATPGGLI